MWFLIGVMLFIYTCASLFLMFVILIQSGKGGGLSSLGSASSGISEALGATGAEKTLNKLTTWSAILFMVLAIMLSLAGSKLARERTAGPLPEAPAAAQPLTQTGAPAAVKPGVPTASKPGAPAANRMAVPAPAPAKVPAKAPAAAPAQKK